MLRYARFPPASLLGAGTLLLATSFAALVTPPAAAALHAQEPAPPRQRPIMPDTLGADTLAADTAQAAARARKEEAAAADSVYQALLRSEGYTPMEYTGERATFRAAERELRLYGPAEVSRAGDRLTAQDTIVYREATRFVEAYGTPTLSGQAEAIEGDVMFYDMGNRRATVRGGRTQVAEAGALWHVRGDVTAEGEDRLYASRSIFTTDDRPEPAYYFESDNIKVIRDRILVGRPARLYFRNVPVFWLPFVVQDLTRGRRSGLLAPEFSLNDIVRTNSRGVLERGTGRQISNVGFYWAISQYMDAQLSGAWRSGDYSGLRGAMQYRLNSQFLNGNFSYSQFWRDTGSRELQFYTNNSWRPDERTNVSLYANYASSTRFLREITTDYFQSTQNLGSSFSLNRRFDWGALALGANRQQSLATGRIEMTLPQIGLSPQPITFFRAASPEEQRWYSNATLSFGGSGSRSTTSFGEDALRTQRDETRTQMQLSQSFSLGNIRMGSSFNMNRTLQPLVPAADTVPLLPRFDRDRAQWSANLGYQIGLIGSTTLSPGLSFSQDLVRNRALPDTAVSDTLVLRTLTGGYLGGPVRMSLNASLRTDLFGFFPGFGPLSTMRHKLSPSISYSYVPEVQLTEQQERIFGRAGGFAQNNVSLSLNQTWEAKLRDSDRPPAERPGADTTAADPADGEAVDTAAVPETQAALPPDERKVTVLSITTSALNYDFARAARGESGFTTQQLTNTVSSDYLRGLQLTMTHDLFDPSGVTEPGQLGRFSPRLSGLTTQFSLGEGAPLLRFLGLGRRTEGAPEQTDSIPAEPLPTEPLDPTRRNPAFTGMPQAAGRGPWSVDVGYTLFRPRDGGVPGQDVRLGIRFSPTDNWGVNWYTNYSIEDGSFGGHRITLRRDLYRWEANFNFSRTPYGNTSFDVLVRLKDLPDLKVDYREANIGANRAP